MRSALETTDIFRGAFFLCSGGRLSEVRFGEDSRRIVTLLIEGDDIDRLDCDYRNGRAMVNPLQFRESLNHLRDIVFAKLREHPATSRPERDYAVTRGRTRYDRKRAHRGYQAQR